MIKIARKRPVEIEVCQWTGDNLKEIFDFCPNAFINDVTGCLMIHTLEGDHTAILGDYIIKGVKGEFYPCKENIFHLTYELIDE